MCTAVAFETPMGWTGVALDAAGSIRRATLFRDTEAAVLAELATAGAEPGEHPAAAGVANALRHYLEGDGSALEAYPVELEAYPASRAKVWLALRTIPAGETRSYGWLAEHTGQSRGASRAIGALMGENPVPLWLPCHRVIASDGTLGGFGGGLPMKMRLLEHECALPRRML